MGNLTDTGYNSSEVEVDSGFEALPVGHYPLMAVESEVKDTKKGDGKIAVFVFEVFEGEGKGRKIYKNFNLVNPSETAQKIGRSQYKALEEAAGKVDTADTTDIHSVPLIGKLGITDDGKYNEIISFAPYQAGGAAPVAAATDTAKTPNWAAK